MTRPSSTETVRTLLDSTSCPFCSGTFSVAARVTDDLPMVLHSSPACQTFLRLDITEYVAEVNRVLAQGLV